MEQASYVGRETMYCEYDGRTYYPKYSEDLVHNEVMLPQNAPEEYRDPKVLWNSVESFEKNSDAQLARTVKVELPNEWSYELATEVMRDYCRRNFTDRGMCVQFAIHDSENRQTGQRNLHCHVLLTLRSLDERGKWMAKQRKVYELDDNGERIPLIDKKTGMQKVDGQNRKQWKCRTVPTNDWNGRENARAWRKDLTDTINAVNEKMGMTDNFWEYRSFKEQGLDIIPQIHLGEKASAMERAGIRTIRGDINRDIIARNAVIERARSAYEQAVENLKAVMAVPVGAFTTVRNEIVDAIREVAKRNRDRLRLPIVRGKFIRQLSDRASLQDRENMERFVREEGLTSFDDLKAYKAEHEKIWDEMTAGRNRAQERISYLEGLLEAYSKYEPYIKYHKEQHSLKGWARKKYETHNMEKLAFYDAYRREIKGMIREDNKDIRATAWRRELDNLREDLAKTDIPYADEASRLAKAEVLEYNRKELERMLENESRKQMEINDKKKREQGR